MPLGRLTYLYAGSADVEKDIAYWTKTVGADLVWDFEGFGTRVAAVRPWKEGPLLLLAGHRPTPTMLPCFAVDDLDASEKDLKQKGWHAEGGRFGLPDGTAIMFKDPSGNEFVIYGDERPRALEHEFARGGGVHEHA